MTLTIAVLLLATASTLGAVVLIVGRQIPVAARAPEFMVNQVARRESVVRKVGRVVIEQYKLLSVMIITRFLRRLKIILLKTDNVASKLLVKIHSYEETLK